MESDDGKYIPKEEAVNFFKCMLNFNSIDLTEEDFVTCYKNLFPKAVMVEIDTRCRCYEMELFNIINLSVDCHIDMERLIAAGECEHRIDGQKYEPTNICGFYPIHIAAGLGNLTLLKCLLKHGCDMFTTTLMKNWYPLDVAIVKGHHVISEFLVNQGFRYTSSKVEQKSNERQRLLSVRTYFEDIEGAKMYIRAGSVISESHWNLLMFQAVENGHLKVVEWLLSLNIGHIDGKIRHGFTALYFATDAGTAQLLLSLGADSSIIIDPNGTALMVHMHQKRLDVAEAIVKFNPSLIDQVVTDNCKHNYYSALHYSAWQGYLEGVKMLCSYGADHTLVSYDGNTALGLACHSDELPCFNYLLSLGCDTNQLDKDGDTALIYAAQNGNSEMVTALVQHGADPSVCNKLDISPLWNAVYSHSLASVQILLSLNVDAEKLCRGQHIHHNRISEIYDVPVSPLFVAIHHEDLSIAKALVAAGCYLNGERYGTHNFEFYVNRWAEDNRRWLDHVTSSPPSLVWWCKRTLRTKALSLNPSACVNQLHLPSSLKEYILDI